jgi:hypothetical protein
MGLREREEWYHSPGMIVSGLIVGSGGAFSSSMSTRKTKAERLALVKPGVTERLLSGAAAEFILGRA